MPKIYGITDMRFSLSPNEIRTIDMTLAVSPGYNPNLLYEFKDWDDMFPGDAVIKCQYCGQWGARKTQCKHCGGAIE